MDRKRKNSKFGAIFWAQNKILNKHALGWFVDLESYIILNMKHNVNNIKEIKYNVM